MGSGAGSVRTGRGVPGSGAGALDGLSPVSAFCRLFPLLAGIAPASTVPPDAHGQARWVKVGHPADRTPTTRFDRLSADVGGVRA